MQCQRHEFQQSTHALGISMQRPGWLPSANLRFAARKCPIGHIAILISLRKDAVISTDSRTSLANHVSGTQHKSSLFCMAEGTLWTVFQQISTAPSRGGLIGPYKGLLLDCPLKEACPDFRRFS